jgi:beta-N-acetylhexosaminidase
MAILVSVVPDSPAAPPLSCPNPTQALSQESEKWIEETLAQLDLRERVGQLVMVWMSGGYASADDVELARVEALVRDQDIGGIVISLGTPFGYASRLNRLQDEADVPLLIAADFEAGPGYRVGEPYSLPLMLGLGGATTFPPAMAFGAADDESLAYEAGRITAIEARAMGVHLNFAPVLDVNNNPANPVINTRSLGADPERVAALGVAYIEGACEGGLLTTAKHFPGHGDTETDTHVALAMIPGDRARLDRIELVPFRRAIAAGVDAVMTAHVAAPQILGVGAVPATLSPYFMTQVLREDLHFDGVLFTDALEMGALVDQFGAEEIAVVALEAGADVLLMPREPERTIDAVVAAVEGGRVTEERVERSVRRVLRLKARAGLDRGAKVDTEAIPRLVGVDAHTSVADTVASRSLTLVRDLAGDVPFDFSHTRMVLSLTFSRSTDLAAGRVFDGRLREATKVVQARTDIESHASVYDSLIRVAAGVDLVLISAYVPPRTSEPLLALPDALARFVSRVEALGTPTVLLSFGTPYILNSLPEAFAYLVAWGGSSVSQRAAADALLGRSPITGRLPISLPPLHAMGEGLDRKIGAFRPMTSDELDPKGSETRPSDVGMDPEGLARVDRILADAIARGTTPGAAIAIGRRGRLVRLRGIGRLDWTAESSVVTDSSLYDLASLTKVIATTTAVMGLVDKDQIQLDHLVGDYLPEWSRGWKASITIRDLLLHRSGLPPFRPFWREMEGKAAYREAIAHLDIAYPLRSRTVYSDIGLMVLSFVVEQITGSFLDDHVQETFFGPLSMRDTRFNPRVALRYRIAPTEMDTAFRHRHLVGEVHDENAYALGGVAGHAGLFSSVRDLARFANWILAAAREGRGLSDAKTLSSDMPSPATVAEFTRRSEGKSSRALGWDIPSGRSSAGRFFGPEAFGHTGFTGTSIWVDPELDLFVVLLTNRVNPTRDNQKHIFLRRVVHDAVASSIRDKTIEPRP